MNSKLTKRFVQGLENIKSSLSKKRGVKSEGAVNQRIGRLRQKYPSISKLYTIELNMEQANIYSALKFKQTNPKMKKSSSPSQINSTKCNSLRIRYMGDGRWQVGLRLIFLL